MTFRENLLKSCPPPVGTLFGDKRAGQAARIAQSQLLTNLMRTRRPFSFLRMGDMELRYLLSYQNGQLSDLEYGDGPTSGTGAFGNPGLSSRHGKRLWQAYQQADYVDFHEKNWPNEHLVPRLKLDRQPDSHKNADKATSLVFLTWTEREFKTYCQGRRIGIAGAEARLLELLSKTSVFKQAAAEYWPGQAEMFFHQARHDGRDLDANLDLVKEDLREFANNNRLDTLFISLGGGAKIIGFELARELGICCFDFGAMTRALTYSGCDGNRVARSTHSPYLYRIPFGVYMDALEQAMPKLTPAQLLAKAHGQLILEVLKKEAGWTHVYDELDLNGENLEFFKRAHQVYSTRYRRHFDSSPESLRERASFLHFCGTHKLTLEGRLFYAKFLAKSAIARLIGKR